MRNLRPLARATERPLPRRVPDGWVYGHRADGAAARGAEGLDPWLARILAEVRQELPGIIPDRTFQIVVAAGVLHQAVKAMDADQLEVSPWALREGVLLRYIESLSWSAPST